MSASVLRVFKIIEYLANCDDWASIRAMERDLEMDATTIHRILNDLKDIGYVRQHQRDSRYQLTLKIAGISARVLEKVQLRHIAHPVMEHLTASTNETTHLAILEGSEMVYIDKVDNNTQAVRMRSRVGQRGQLYCTAVGKALLAWQTEAALNEILPTLSFHPATQHTITSADAFIEQLKRIREMGYSIDDEENEVGIRCIGSPIFDHAGRPAGALSISGWTITMTRERIPHLAAELILSCQNISKNLGFIDDK